MDGPHAEPATCDLGRLRPSVPLGERANPVGESSGAVAGGSSFRVDPGHDRFRLDRAGQRWWNRSGWTRSSVAVGREPTNPEASDAAACLLAPSDRDALALVHLINWVTAETSASASPRIVEGAGRGSLIRLNASATDLAGYALVVGDVSDREVDAEGFPFALQPTRVERASLHPEGDWWAADLRGTAGRFRFRAFYQGAFRAEVMLGARGEDLVLPSLAALAIGVRLGLAAGEVGDRLAECPAVPRRFEPRGSYCGATLVDDDAGGSEGVAGALALARAAFGRRTIRAVFLPHDERDGGPAVAGEAGSPLAADFHAADHLILVVRDASRPESARHLAASLRSSGASVVLCTSLSGAIRELDRTLGPGDVVLTLGADAVGMIADALLRRLARDRHG